MAENIAASDSQGRASGGGARKQTSGSGNGRAGLTAIIIAVVLVGLFFIGLLPRMKQNRIINARADAAKTEVPKVIVMKPQPSQQDALTLPGSTQAIMDAQVGARTTGYVSKRYVDIGAHVHAGQVLAEIESPDVDQQLSQANAQTAQSQATVAQSQADVIGKQATVTQYRSNVQQTQANLEQSRAQLADSQAKLAQLQAAEKTAEAQRDQAQSNVGIKQAALKQANTQMQLNLLTYQRYQSLQKSGFVALQDVDQSRANYENSQAAVNSAQSDLNSALKIVEGAESGVRSAEASVKSGEAQVRASQKNVKAVAATITAAQSTVNAALANVESGRSIVNANRSAQAANMANARRFNVLTSFEKVTAPFDGIITARNIEVGSLVNTGNGATSSSGVGVTSAANLGSASTGATGGISAGLFGLARTDVLRILVAVPQAFAPMMHAGVTTQVSIREFPGQTFMGTVTHVSGALDTVSRTLLTEVHLPNPNGKLLPGMYAQIAFDLPKSGNGLRVPATAVLFDGQGTRVAVVTPENKIHFTPVRQGRDFNTEIEIIEGVKEGDTVVVNPSDDLTEGQKVEPTLQKPSPPAGSGGAPGHTPPAAAPNPGGEAPKTKQ